jgi:hypothetical protein
MSTGQSPRGPTGARRDIDVEGLIKEARRYAQAALAGVAISFVMIVADPGSPPTYVIAIGFFVAALVLVLLDRWSRP